MLCITRGLCAALWHFGLEEGVAFGGKALGWMAGTLIWMPRAPGKRTLPGLTLTYRPCPSMQNDCWFGVEGQMLPPPPLPSPD